MKSNRSVSRFRQYVFFAVVSVFSAVDLAAQTSDIGNSLKEKLQGIIDIVQSGWFVLVVTLAVLGGAVGMVINKDNEQVKKRFMTIGAAGIIFAVAGAIANAVVG